MCVCGARRSQRRHATLRAGAAGVAVGKKRGLTAGRRRRKQHEELSEELERLREEGKTKVEEEMRKYREEQEAKLEEERARVEEEAAAEVRRAREEQDARLAEIREEIRVRLEDEEREVREEATRKREELEEVRGTVRVDVVLETTGTLHPCVFSGEEGERLAVLSSGTVDLGRRACVDFLLDA